MKKWRGWGRALAERGPCIAYPLIAYEDNNSARKVQGVGDVSLTHQKEGDKVSLIVLLSDFFERRAVSPRGAMGARNPDFKESEARVGGVSRGPVGRECMLTVRNTMVGVRPQAQGGKEG